VRRSSTGNRMQIVRALAVNSPDVDARRRAGQPARERRCTSCRVGEAYQPRTMTSVGRASRNPEPPAAVLFRHDVTTFHDRCGWGRRSLDSQLNFAFVHDAGGRRGTRLDHLRRRERPRNAPATSRSARRARNICACRIRSRRWCDSCAGCRSGRESGNCSRIAVAAAEHKRRCRRRDIGSSDPTQPRSPSLGSWLQVAGSTGIVSALRRS